MSRDRAVLPTRPRRASRFLGIATTAAVVSIGAVGWVEMSNMTTARVVELSPATVSVLLELGISPRSAAAAGLDASAVAAMFSLLEQQLSTEGTTLRTRTHQASLAFSNLRAAESRVQSGKSAPEDLTALAQARVAAESAETALTQSQQAAFTAATASLSTQQRAILRRIADNRAWNLPTEYLAAAYDETNFLLLQNALEHVAQHPANAAPEAATTVADANANSDVAAAKQRLASQLATVQTAWDQQAGS